MSKPLSLSDRGRGSPEEDRLIVRKGLGGRLRRSWKTHARPAQFPPEGDWRTWLIMAGRGFGKTRAGAAGVNRIAARGTGIRSALVGATAPGVRTGMVGGRGVHLAACGAPRPSGVPPRRDNVGQRQ